MKTPRPDVSRARSSAPRIQSIRTSAQTPQNRSKDAGIIITMGDPSGVGPESVLLAIQKLYHSQKPPVPITVIGSKKILNKVQNSRHALSIIECIDLDNVDLKKWHWGKIDSQTGRAAREYIDTALALLLKDTRSTLVTAPVSKEAVQAGGTDFPGHTEYLAGKTGIKEYIMLFKGAHLFISLITRHVSLQKVPKLLKNIRSVQETIELTFRACKELKNVPKPRIGLCGFNPHAGIDTFLGTEEKLLLRALKNTSCVRFVEGPYPADTLLMKLFKEAYDAVVCVYHDQAMIPFKLIDFDSGINVTYGLPFLRVSPVYGTAKDIAGKGSVNYASMTAAIKYAIDHSIAQRCLSDNHYAYHPK